MAPEAFRRGADDDDAELLEPRPGGGAATAAWVSALALRMMSGGVFAGAKSAYHEDTSNPGTPDSAMVGNSGIAGMRFALVTASARSLPALMSGITAPMLLNITSTLPGTRSWSAGPAPR